MIVATRNPHKIAELARLLPDQHLEALPAHVALGPETGETFAANALAKARAAARATGAAAVADDSGILAAALGGAPGVRSARFAGERATDEENLVLLIRLVPPGTALAYECAIAYVDPGAGVERVFAGRCEGRMASARRGSAGFGYDPVFVPAEEGAGGRTMAQLESGEKDAISHRGRAARALAAWLAGDGDGR